VATVRRRLSRLDRFGIARSLRETARLLDLAGEPHFKVRAYERAAKVLERTTTDIAVLVDQGRLTELPGIGPRLARLVTELHLTGTSEILEELRRTHPAGAAELSRIPELNLRRIELLNRALGIETIAQLRQACEGGHLRAVKGIGAKTEQRILDRIRRIEGPRRVLLPEAREAAEAILAHLRHVPGAVMAETAGDLRRFTETVGALVLVLACTRSSTAVRQFRSAPLVSAANMKGSLVRGSLADGLPLEVRVVSPRSAATQLLFATGAPGHVERLQAIAGRRGLRLEAAGLSRRGKAGRISVENEAEVYQRLGLPFIAPELRENTGEIEAALAGTLPSDLISGEDIRGMVHCHTVYSDGSHTVEEMAKAADALGMEYLTITDHSQSAAYAGGLSVDRLREQWDEIARVQETVDVRLLRGSEVDILADGALDYPDSILEQLDVVIASVHRRFRLDAAQMTARLTRAMSHPCFKIWGHALGRLLLSRPPIECRVEEVLDAVAASRAAVEINGDPHRLDLAPQWIRAARERGIHFVISVDAHAMREYANVDYGIAMARRGWVRRSEVLNALDARAFARAVSPTDRPR
jgi:DNA polymerase (family X)